MGVRDYRAEADAELLECSGRDPEAFGELFARHADAVRAYCARRTGDLAMADDLTSVAFLEAFRHRARVVLVDGSALAWIIGVARNASRNAERSRRRHRAALARLPRPSADDGLESRVAERDQLETALRDARSALAALSRDEADVVELVVWGGLAYDGAAVALGVPIGTVRSRLARARAKLSDLITVPDKELP